MSDYLEAGKEVEKLAKRIINEHHPQLRGVMIRYIFSIKPLTAKNKELLGKTQKVSGLNAFLATADTDNEGEEFVVVMLSKQAWEVLDDARKEALLDHELCHVKVKEDTGKPYLVTHDLEEFNQIVERHGAWQSDIVEFLRHAKQPPLPGLAEEKPKATNKGKKPVLIKHQSEASV